MKYKAVFEESFGVIHINSRRNFHECSDGNFSEDIRKDLKGKFEEKFREIGIEFE